MSTTGLIVAAVSGGALLATATMHTVRAWSAQRHEASDDRVDLVTQAIVDGVREYRREASTQDAVSGAPDSASIEVRTKAHLRLLVRKGPPRGPLRGGPAARGAKSARARGR